MLRFIITYQLLFNIIKYVQFKCMMQIITSNNNIHLPIYHLFVDHLHHLAVETMKEQLNNLLLNVKISLIIDI